LESGSTGEKLWFKILRMCINGSGFFEEKAYDLGYGKSPSWG
jgi:hypothetical protein